MIESDTDDSNAREELKRADHLLFVTLKYTKTCEVIKSVISKLISAIDFAVLEALEKLKFKNISDIARMRIDQLSEKIPKLDEYISFYRLLRRVDRAKYKTREEYRKNVTLVTDEGEVNIENLKEYFEKTKKFILLLEEYFQ